MQITMRYHFILMKMAIIKRQAVVSVSEDVEKLAASDTEQGNVKQGDLCGEQFDNSPKC